MAGEGTIPRDNLGTLREDPLAITLVVEDDEIILKKLSHLNLFLRRKRDTFSFKE